VEIQTIAFVTDNIALSFTITHRCTLHHHAYISLSNCSCFALILYIVPFVIHKDRGSLRLKTFIKFVVKVIWVKGYFKLFFSLLDSFYFGYNFLKRFYYPSSINYLLEFIYSQVSQYLGMKFCCYSNLFLLDTSAATVTSCL